MQRKAAVPFGIAAFFVCRPIDLTFVNNGNFGHSARIFGAMRHQPDKPLVTNGENAERDAETLETKFGDLAKTYAENRLEAAKLRGADDDAEHWQEVESEIEDSEAGE